MIIPDRLKKAFYALFRASTPRLDYYTTYRAKVIAQSKDFLSLDVQPDDARIPSMGGVRLKHGIPGTQIEVRPGAFVNVGWYDGDPSKPFCALYEGDESAPRITIVADKIELGGSGLDIIQQGALNGEAVDPYTGLKHWQLGNASQVVLVKKS